MRYFWGLMAVLVVVTAALFAIPAGEAPATTTPVSAPPSSTEAAQVDPSDVTVEVVEPVKAVSDGSEGAPGNASAAQTETALPAIDPAPEPEPVAPAEPEALPAQVAAAPVEPAPTTPPEAKEVTLSPQALEWLRGTFGPANPEAQDDLRAKSDRPDAALAVAEREQAEAKARAEALEPAPPAAAEAAAAVDQVAVDQVELQPDGSLRIGGRWTVTGDGTQESPYVLDWRVLTSASQIYRPRLGETELPAWATMLAGKRVKLTGFAMLPAGGGDQRELLLMLNEWDGCCIGVPPTPYDAAEVKLGSPRRPSAGAAAGHTGTSAYGDVVGTLKIDPYIVRGWLLGLYVIEDASFTALAGG